MSMVRSSRHTGIVVRDIENSLRFYRDILGLELTTRACERGAYIERVVGLAGAVVDWAKLRTPDGYIVELLQYRSHPDTASHAETSRVNRLGCSHLALTVFDLQAVHSALIRQGLLCNSEPQRSPDGKVQVLYAHDPDGAILELVEELPNPYK